MVGILDYTRTYLLRSIQQKKRNQQQQQHQEAEEEKNLQKEM